MAVSLAADYFRLSLPERPFVFLSWETVSNLRPMSPVNWIGILCALPCFVLFSVPDLKTCLFLMLPLLLDGFAQRLTSYQSGNLRRLVTGVLFGYALVGLVSIDNDFLQRRQDLSLEKI